MQKGKLYSKVGLFISIMLIVFWLTISISSEIKEKSNNSSVPSQSTGVDLICINTLNDLGGLERLPVIFPHDSHVKTLSNFGRDCTSCHMMEGDKLSLKFQRLTNGSRKEIMQTYHSKCIECHQDNSIPSNKAKPVTCGDCHSVSSQEYVSFWEPIKFDKYLHYTHEMSNDKKCEICHHEYDDNLDKLVYKKGNEGSCKYCHKESATNNVSSIRNASHQACIECHREKKSKKIKSGPINCIGCHSSSNESLLKKSTTIPRMDRGQPSIILIKSASIDAKLDELKRSGCMDLVPFDHKLHEKDNDSCNICHHASLESCSKCHSKVGNSDGKQVTIAEAMHNDAESSCIGCHRSKQKSTNCIGCHHSNKKNVINCKGCHLSGLAEELESGGDNNFDKIITERLTNNRVEKGSLFNKESIPENVIISNLENKYEAVNFPHRKIVLSLFNNLESNKLAKYFHNKGTLCLGCHHNSPPSEKPPACINCHSYNTGILTKPFKPKLVGAYHQRCIKCHNLMGLEKPDSRDCSSCHANKSNK